MGINIDDFYNKYTESKIFYSNRSLKLCFEIKDNLSKQRKSYYEKIEIGYYKNKMIDTKIFKKYIDHILNYKIDSERWKENSKKLIQKSITILLNEIYIKEPKKSYPTNKTDVYHIVDIWSLDLLDLKAFVPKTLEDTDMFWLSKTFSQNMDGQFL